MTLRDRMREIARRVIWKGNTLFEVGDTVRCIKPIDGLVLNKTYTVSFVNHKYLGLDGCTVPEWYIDRFVLDESPAQDSYLELFI